MNPHTKGGHFTQLGRSASHAEHAARHVTPSAACTALLELAVLQQYFFGYSSNRMSVEMNEKITTTYCFKLRSLLFCSIFWACFHEEGSFRKDRGFLGAPLVEKFAEHWWKPGGSSFNWVRPPGLRGVGNDGPPPAELHADEPAATADRAD